MRAARSLTLALLLAGGAAAAVPAQTLLSRAAEAESRRDHAAAARDLEELVASGFDGRDIVANLGHVYTEAGRFGEAIWCYERVLRRRVVDLEVQHNLQATRLRLARRDAARTGRAVVETPPPLSVQWGELLPRDVSVTLTLLGELLIVAAWAWRRRSESEMARVGATAALCTAVVFTGFTATVMLARWRAPVESVVLHDGLRLLQAPRVDAVPAEAVREGERVTTVGHEAGFLRVRADHGHSGWLRETDLGPLGP
ncbi:MAG: tetratricopeptide repeat protein [Myxococcales bacterium]|nr:tetratricopeptide repeat protein [Myxococcales bacterium]